MFTTTLRLIVQNSKRMFSTIQTSIPSKAVAQITISRPPVNALNKTLFTEINSALKQYEVDASIKVVLLTGSKKAFAAGADIKEMSNLSFSDAYIGEYITHWSEIMGFSKPVVAAVRGFAFGGGCELAMMADILYASEAAVFGQPEIKLGVIPGAGGSQRLAAAIGKSKAMELILTGRTFSAFEAEKWGLVSRVCPDEEVEKEALKTCEDIAQYSALAIKAAKEVVNASFEMPLSQGLRYERRLFHALFGTANQKEGMKAFIEKRNPDWKDE